MLEKFKQMLSFAPTVDFVTYEDGLLAVKSNKKLTEKNTSIKLKTSLGTLLAEVAVESYDAQNGVYRLRLFDRETILPPLHVERRDEPRLLKVLRVTSQSFPGFAGMSDDLSVSGARVTTTGALEITYDIQITIELDDPEIPPVVLYADVAWTAQKLDGGYHSGLRFQAMTQEQVRTIRRYIEEKMALEKKLHKLEG